MSLSPVYLYFPVCPPVCLSLSVSISLSVSVSLGVYLCLSLSLYLSRFLFLSIFLSFCLSLCLSPLSLLSPASPTSVSVSLWATILPHLCALMPFSPCFSVFRPSLWVSASSGVSLGFPVSLALSISIQTELCGLAMRHHLRNASRSSSPCARCVHPCSHWPVHSSGASIHADSSYTTSLPVCEHVSSAYICVCVEVFIC